MIPLWGVCAGVRSLVGELRSHMPRSSAKKKKEQMYTAAHRWGKIELHERRIDSSLTGELRGGGR